MKLCHVAVALLVVSCCASLACSSSSEVGPGQDAGVRDSASADSSLPDAELDAAADAPVAACNDVPQQGLAVRVVNTQAPPPAPAGGPIGDGTWVLTTAKVWGSSAAEGAVSGRAASTTWVVLGSKIDIVATTATTKSVTRSSGTIKTSGTELTLEQTCPEPAQQNGGAPGTPYTATAATLSVFTAQGASTFVMTLIKKE